MILTEPLKGKAVLIPRMPIFPTDIAFQFKILQFSVRLELEITNIEDQS